MFLLYFPNQDDCKLLMIFPAKQFSCFLPCSSGPSWLSPLPNLSSREKHTSTIYRNKCKEIASYIKNTTQMQDCKWNIWLQITGICLSVFAECSSLHLSLSRSNIPVGGDLPLKLWGDLLSVCLVPLSHKCTALAQRIIYMKYIFDIFLYNNP